PLHPSLAFQAKGVHRSGAAAKVDRLNRLRELRVASHSPSHRPIFDDLFNASSPPVQDGCHNDVGLTTARVDCAVSTLTALGSNEAEMRIIGCDLHASQQAIAMLDRETGEVVERTLQHEGTVVRDFYADLPPPIVV